MCLALFYADYESAMTDVQEAGKALLPESCLHVVPSRPMGYGSGARIRGEITAVRKAL